MKIQELYSSPEKWCKHALIAGQACCLVGALDDCYPGAGVFQHAAIKIQDAIEKLYGPEYAGVEIAWFNDRPETTFEDILKVVREADV